MAKFATVIYMIFTDTGIVLFKQDFREADRLISLYTLEHGRINLRLPGVNRAKGKLKALSEPFTYGSYRIYVRRGSVVGTVTGGKIESVFPTVRKDLKRLPLALHFCELIHKLTPPHQASDDKFALLLKGLTELEYGEPNSAFAAAFTLRLMQAAGFGLDHPVLQISPEFWARMHEDEFSNLTFSAAEELLSLGKCNSVCRRFLNQYLNFPLNTLKSFTLADNDYLMAHQELPEEELATLPELAPLKAA